MLVLLGRSHGNVSRAGNHAASHPHVHFTHEATKNGSEKIDPPADAKSQRCVPDAKSYSSYGNVPPIKGHPWFFLGIPEAPPAPGRSPSRLIS